MIRKLKRKFIVLALVALFVLLAFVVAGMNWLNYRSVVEEADTTLDLLAKNSGVFPDMDEDKPWWATSGISPEVAFESRFFSVLLSEVGNVLFVDTSRIYAVDKNMAVDYALKIWESMSEKGFCDDYRYRAISEGPHTRVLFLDCGRKMDMCHDFVKTSIGMAVAGYLVIALIICIVAGRFVRPVAESYDRQKRFITDAGHEIKTPLTIIRANVDLLEMDLGENECLEEIRQQSKRLSGLTNDLVYLAKMEEAQSTLPMVDFPMSEVVADTASPFAAVAQRQRKELVCNIQPTLTLRGNEKAIARLVSILLDNALKYSPEESKILLSLGKQGRHIILTVSNISVTPVNPDDLLHVFERFYRLDASRNSETGGHGIGLSMAQAIVEDHGGKIGAYTADGQSFTVAASFPG
ncbi:MAG: HAMP domain-containing histidine kinase [Lachnospiraceae bacterium]|nr:HAMP domain-containing histidine kinase [Lachnospiraceae bacterium]